ncbi:HNH endonuclease [Desulfobotulus mexicanus]|uniref:HNH endonuclease n=1 Tax=Desulfobotulus mexicanus TaxID=2586642 RepID=A0A5Q4VGE3_9BACT|nr:HNH endonuclease [Desulfobotulus mexicanus]TYT76008.1 HNH endonuclease [Desulfobotulus mexicanus]
MEYQWFEDDVFVKKERQKARELRQTEWWKRQCAKGSCSYCGRSVAAADLTMDHVVPLARGGRSTKGNVVTACKACNTKKKQMLPLEWEVWLLQAEEGRGKG